MSAAKSAWIGAAPSAIQQIAIVFVGAMPSVALLLQPILLSELLAEHRLSTAEVGYSGAAEMLAAGLASALASARLRHEYLRVIGVVVGVILVAINIATTHLGGLQIVAARGAAGLCSGIYMWIAAGMLARAPKAVRIIGIMSIFQGVMSLILSSSFSTVIVPRVGVNGSYLAMGSIAAVMAASSLLFPDRFAPLPAQTSGAGAPPPRGIVTLAAVFVYLSGTMAAWIYTGAMALQATIAQAVAGRAFSLAFAAQMLGGLAASVAANRLSAIPVVVSGMLVNAVLVAFLSGAPSVVLFAVTLVIHSAVWVFAATYLFPLLVAVDPTRKAAMYSQTAQLLGSAAGPALGSILVQSNDVRPALWAGAMLCVIAALLVFAAAIRPGRSQCLIEGGSQP